MTVTALVLRCGRLFDGVADRLTGPVEILVQGQRIADIAPSVRRPLDAQVIDLSHHTASPGFIDCHVHLTMDAANLARQTLVSSAAKALKGLNIAREYMRYGFTTLRNMGCVDDADYPQVARDFKQAIANVDAVLFVTPEYNRSIPGALKNAIDWASRPWGKNSFARKPSGVIGTSPGAIGTAVAQQQLRGVLCFCNSPLMNTLEAYIHFKPGLITEDGDVTDASTADFLRNYLKELHVFIERVLTVLPKEG